MGCAQSRPKSPKVAQSRPKSPKVAHNCPMSPRVALCRPKSPNVAQNCPMLPKIAQCRPKSPRVAQRRLESRKSPKEVMLYGNGEMLIHALLGEMSTPNGNNHTRCHSANIGNHTDCPHYKHWKPPTTTPSPNSLTTQIFSKNPPPLLRGFGGFRSLPTA